MLKTTLIRLLFLLICTSALAQSETAKPTGAALLAEEQLQAYNQKDIEALLYPYSDSVRIFGSL